MEAGTISTTASTTIADLLPRAAEMYADKVAVRHKVGDDWVDVTFAQVGETVSEIARGLIDLGIQKGDRVSLLCNTRPEWTYSSFAISSAGGVVVPIYPTNAPEECEWVAGNSESVGIVCEDASQIAKIQEVRANLPALKWIITIDAEGDIADAILLDEIRARGRERAEADLTERRESVGPDDGYTFIYTSGTTGPPKGCVLLHRNYRSVLHMINERGLLGAEGDIVYLFLPLAHAFALLIQLGAVDTGTTVAYFGGDAKQIIPELMQVHPTYLPSVPRIFEKLFTLAQGQIPAPVIAAISDLGGQIQDLEHQGQPVPQELLDRWNAPIEGDEQGRSLAQISEFVKGLFGGNLREAVTGAAPIASEILRFFYGAASRSWRATA